ncbi:MAG: hypothetical protein Q7J07_08000, partial [Pelolinea sp.]|nr:hypothetical protein [Pelolinea sp.]
LTNAVRLKAPLPCCGIIPVCLGIGQIGEICTHQYCQSSQEFLELINKLAKSSKFLSPQQATGDLMKNKFFGIRN